MAEHGDGKPAGAAPARGLMSVPRRTIAWLSALGLALMILGMVALTLPVESEGPILWTLTPQHSITLLDLLSTGLIVSGIGLVLISAYLWQKSYGNSKF